MAAIFPGAVATQLQLLTAQNNSMVVLDANCDLDDDVITVDDASALPNSGYMTFIDTDEVIYYAAKTSNTLTGVVRGADGTSAASHLAGVDLEQRWNADYHNIVTLEMIATEQYLSDRFGITSAIIVPTGKVFTITDGLGIGATVDSKAILSLTSTTKGFLPPVMTTTQRDAISSPTNGLVIYNSTTSALNVYRSSAWKALLVPGLADIVNADVNASAAIAYSKLTLTGSIVNADVSASAAIAYSKLALTGAILNADLAGSIAYSKLSLTGAILNADLAGSIAYSKLVLTTSIVNGDISTSAAIARSKLAALTASRLMVTDGSGFDSVNSVTATEAGYLSGVTSAIQTQFTAKASLAGDTFTGDVIMDNQKGIKFREGSGGGTNFAKLQAPATLAGDYTLTLPVDDGTSGQALTTDGSGVLSWGDVLSGTNQPLNILCNGGFEIWQRTTSFSAPANNAYTSDRWKVGTNEAANVTVSRDSGTFDAVGLYSMKVLIASAGASKTWYVGQPIENYADYRGKVLTFSVRVFSSVASAISIVIEDSSGSNISSYHSGGGGWETLTVTRTVGAAATSLTAYIGCQNNGDKKNGTYYFDSAMLCLGSTALAYVGEDTTLALRRCLRYYETSGTQQEDTLVIAHPNTTPACYNWITFIAPKRAAPTVTVTKGSIYLQHDCLSGAGAGTEEAASWTATAAGITAQGFTRSLQRSSNQTTYPLMDFINFSWVAEAEM